MKCRSCGQPEDLSDRVQELRDWASSRIRQCYIDEQKFGAGAISIEAARERMTLLAVMRVLQLTPITTIRDEKRERDGGGR